MLTSFNLLQCNAHLKIAHRNYRQLAKSTKWPKQSGQDKLTNNGTGYIKDITEVSVEEFTNIIEKIADARAENGAEQQRVNQSLSLQQNNLVNLEAAHGRIMDVDVALESTRLARHSVTVQASAAMVAQANQMTAVALTLLSN